MRKKARPEFGLIRTWTSDDKNFTHWAIIGHESDPAEKVGCIVVEHGTEEDAKLSARKALEEMKYGEIHVFPSHGHTFGFAVHYPRFKSEGTGFINFHSVHRFFLA